MMKTAKKVALLGFDCALTNLVREHIKEGLCPNFKKVFENGTVAENCLVPFPTITPPNWTSMITGAWPGTNNVTDFWAHIPGTTPEGANSHPAFDWDYVRAESFWEAAEKAGKRSILLNFPMSFNAHKKLKNGIVVGGANLTPGLFTDTYFFTKYRGEPFSNNTQGMFSFSEEVMVSTDIYPGNAVRIKFTDATGWSRVGDMGDSPLEATFRMPFAHSMYNKGTTYAEWHILVRDLGDGYNTVTLAPGKDFSQAFFTCKTGEWSKAFDAEGLLENGGSKTCRMMAKVLSLNEDDADSFSMYISNGLNKDGELWCYPPEKAALMNRGAHNHSTSNAGFLNITQGWTDLDTWLEIIGIHYDWLGDAAEALLTEEPWDIFYSHAHPTDFIYHALITDLDPDTCSSPAAHQKAWDLHRELYRHADRYLGRLLALMGDDTLVVLISDHGATPDGPYANMEQILADAGLLSVKEPDDTPEFRAYIESCPENIRENILALMRRTDPAKSRAIPQRCCYVYVNLKGRDPEGIVDPAEYHKIQRQIIDAMMAYKHPQTGQCPFVLALPKLEAEILGLWGDQVGDVVYAYWPEYTMQHGPILPSSEYGIGTLKPLCVFYGPKVGVKKGYSMDRHCNLVDLVPTFCYMTGWPVPKDAEGSVIYQLMEEPDYNTFRKN